MSSSVRPVVRKKAALCLLRLFRRNPDVLNKEDWCAPRVLGAAQSRWIDSMAYIHRADAFFSLLDERDLGLLTSVLSFLQALVATDAVWCALTCLSSLRRPVFDHKRPLSRSFRSCAPKVVRLLERLASQQGIPQDYMYYGVPSPWLQIKCMRVLQQFPLADDPSLAGAVAEVLRRIVSVCTPLLM
jgi:AP-2 complex subunit alpha